MINVDMEETRPGYVRPNFDINLAAAERAKLKLDTQLLTSGATARSGRSRLLPPVI